MFSLFNSHEKRVDKAYRCYKPEMVSMVFPEGKKQASGIIKSIARLCEVDLKGCDAKEYFEILSIYSDVLIRRIVTQSTDRHIATSLQVKHSKHVKSESVAQSIVVYCDLNMKDNNFFINSAADYSKLELYLELVRSNNELAETNSKAQEENLDDPEYGLVPEKPIYAEGVEGSRKYLNSLKTLSGEKLSWERVGTTGAEGVNGIIDIYVGTLPSGEEYETLYVNMYGTKNSTVAPQGFIKEEFKL